MWPFVVFCDLLCFCMMVCGAKCNFYGYTAVFCGICDNYGIYGGTVGLQCISIFFSGDFHTISWFSAKFGCFGWNMIFWFGPKQISWLFR